MAKRSVTRSRPARGLARTDTAALRRELERRTGLLVARRDKLLAELSVLDAELHILGVAGSSRRNAGGGRRNARNKTSLVEALRAALKGKTMSATEALAAIAAAGHKSTARTLPIQVRNALGNKEHFKRVARGRYTAK